MKKETLDTMWQVITENKKPFVQFLNRKASMLGLEKLSWYDVEQDRSVLTERSIRMMKPQISLPASFQRLAKSCPHSLKKRFGTAGLRRKTGAEKESAAFAPVFLTAGNPGFS